jgi:hypothetical protein
MSISTVVRDYFNHQVIEIVEDIRHLPPPQMDAGETG